MRVIAERIGNINKDQLVSIMKSLGDMNGDTFKN